MRMSEKCRNNSSDNPLTSRRSYGGKSHVNISEKINQLHIHGTIERNERKEREKKT